MSRMCFPRRVQWSVAPYPGAKTTLGPGGSRVAVVVPHILRWLFAALMEELEPVLRAADLDVLLDHVDRIKDRHDFSHRLPARRKVNATAAQIDQRNSASETY